MILSSIEREAVKAGRASIRPGMSGVAYSEGLTDDERRFVADAHADVPNIQHTPWSEATKRAVRASEGFALRAALAARPAATDPAPALPWEREVRTMLGSLGYTRGQASAAVCWIVSRGALDGIPFVDRSDWPAVNALVARHAEPEPEPEYESALDWPDWTDKYVYEPTHADRVWNSSGGEVDLLADGPVKPADLKPVRVRRRPHAPALMSLPPISGGSPDAGPLTPFRFWHPGECKPRDERERFGSHGYDDRAEPNDRD